MPGHSHRHLKPPKHPWQEKSPSVVPSEVQAALRQAMLLEHVAPGDFNDLLWIMAQESGGQVNATNPSSTAGDVYQLLRAQYDLYPHGEASLGNAVEECQGGIRYILGRYHTAKLARAFWEKHHWY